jgi:phenylalanyl-tRNA synthetase beta chain
LKFSYAWLRELIPGLDTGPAELQRLITMKTAECEGIEAYGAHFTDVVAVRVLEARPLPKGKNQALRIETGNGKGAVTVVCGAPNVRIGMLAPWVPPGTAVEGKSVGRIVIEGVESEGMLASAAELGINRDQSGLLELVGLEPGKPLPEFAPDWIIEIDNKSLTHRPDLWGHVGMAREVAAITTLPLVDPVRSDELPSGPPPIEVNIEDRILCPRYSALVFEKIRVNPAPLRLQARLQSIGLNPISNIVDITNYVLSELPQPMHAFDADKLAGHTIYVRNARPGERLHALNGETYDLVEADLVIADASGPIALAGVIGGAESAISETTTRIVFESANFQASTVRLTSARHKLRTDASMRFEKSLDPENTIRGLARAAQLIRSICPDAKAVGGVADSFTPPPALKPIALPVEFVTRKLGTTVGKERITRILNALGFHTAETTPELLTVTVPTWRATKDISLKDDLVEEVGRMVGYDAITPAAPALASVVPPENTARVHLTRLRRIIADQGFTEVYNYSFLHESDIERFGLDLSRHIAVRNPIASEFTHLRRSLLPGLYRNLLANVRHCAYFRIFEIGNELYPETGATEPEQPHLAALLYDKDGNEQDFFEMKRVLACLFRNATCDPASARSYEHPARTAEIRWRTQTIGRISELHPGLLEAEKIEGRAFVFDVDLLLTERLFRAEPFRYQPIRRFPTSGFDLSVVSASKEPVARIHALLSELAGSNLAALEFVRQYDGPPLPAGTKSVTFHLEVGELDRTITNEEASAMRDRIISGMREHGFDLRV